MLDDRYLLCVHAAKPGGLLLPQLLPHQRLPCKPDWVVYSYGVLKDPGPRYIVSTIMPIEQHMLARPPKSDGWHFSNAAHANAWLQKQRAFVAALPAEGQPALLDLGRVAADNAGVRCDGMHFAKNWERGIMAKVKCATSAAAYDEALLGALRTHCGCKGVADAAGGARERKRR